VGAVVEIPPPPPRSTFSLATSATIGS
jgi:hypothetical protein